MQKKVKFKKCFLQLSFLVLFSTIIFILPNQAVCAEFSDIQGNWAEKQINDWLNKDLVGGYPDGTFKPNKEVTRAEFVALLNRAFRKESKATEADFKDVKSSDWFYADVAVANAEGYSTGYQDGSFKPQNPITRQEAASVIFRLLKLDTIQTEEYFVDAGSIADWARGSVTAVAAAGIMAGYSDGTFKGSKPITRAEAVVTLNRATKASLSKATADNYNQAGTYGPPNSQETFTGDVEITAPGVTLRNMIITGNLTLGEGIGEGEVILKNVTVLGKTVIRGGGAHSVTLENCVLPDLTVAKEGVRIVATGNTTANLVTLETGAVLDHSTGTGRGIDTVIISQEIPANSNVSLLGNFKTVNIKAANINFGVADGTVGSLHVSENAAETELNIAGGATVNELTLDAAVTVRGKGKIFKANVNASGSKMEQSPINLYKAQGVTVKIGTTTSSSGGGSSNYGDVTKPVDTVTYDKPGTYGPEGIPVIVDKDVVIAVAGVTLCNIIITGDLEIAAGVGDGEVTLKNVTVDGTTNINGGGAHSANFEDCTLPTVNVNKEGVRIVARGNTSVSVITLQSGATLVEISVSGEGFESVTLAQTIPAGASVELDGDFESVDMQASNLNVAVTGGTVVSFNVDQNALGAVIDVASNASLTTLTLNSAAIVNGTGKIQTANVNASGSTIKPTPGVVNKESGIEVTIGNEAVVTTGSIKGKVLYNGEGIENIVVSYDMDDSISTVTDVYGDYFLADVPAGPSQPVYYNSMDHYFPGLYYLSDPVFYNVAAGQILQAPDVTVAYSVYGAEQLYVTAPDSTVAMEVYGLAPDISNNTWILHVNNGTVKDEISTSDLEADNLPSGLGITVSRRAGNDILVTVVGTAGTPVAAPVNVRLKVKAGAVEEAGMLDSPWVIVTIAPDNDIPGEEVEVQYINITDITGGMDLSIKTPGGTLQLVAGITPDNASNKRVLWSAPVDEMHPFNAVTVDENTGLVRAVNQGMGKVMAAAQDGSGVTGVAMVFVNYLWEINSNDPPQGNAGKPYTYQLTSTLDGSGGEVTYSLASGTLPGGLSLSPAGQISGTPSKIWGETCSFTVQAEHSSGAQTTRDFTITVLTDVSITAQIDSGSEQDQTVEIGDFSLLVPAGALGESSGQQTLTVTSVTGSMPDHDFNGSFPAFGEIGTYNITIGNITEFASPLTLSLPFDTSCVYSDLPLGDAVKVSYYREYTDGGQTYGQWVNVPCTVDGQAGKVVFQTNHLTSWRIEYLVRGYKTKNTTHFSIMYEENGAAIPVGFKQYTPEELAELIATDLEEAYQDYKNNGIKVPGATTTVILQGGLYQSETSTVLGNICMATAFYDSDAHVKFDCYHELMHTVEREYFYIPYYLDNRWLMEAVADAAGGIAAPDAGKMADGNGLKPNWFDEVITTADGKHEYAAAFFIAYMCDVQHYARWLPGAITPSVPDKNGALNKIGSMLDALDKGSYDVFDALDSWLNEQDPKINNCPDLKAAYANFVHHCFYGPYSPLVLPDDASISRDFAREEVTLTTGDTTATIELNMGCRGGIQTKVVNIEPWEGENGALPVSRAIKVEYAQGEPADGAVLVSQIYSNDYLDNQSAAYYYEMIPDPQVKDKAPFVWALNGNRIYLTGASLSPDAQSAAIRISEPTEISLKATHSAAECRDIENNIVGYEHTYNVTGSVPDNLNMINKIATLITWEEEANGSYSYASRAYKELENGTCTIKYYSESPELDAYIVLEGAVPPTSYSNFAFAYTKP